MRRVTAAIFSADFDKCSCVVAAAAAMNTTGGAVTTSARAADILGRAAGAVMISTGELRRVTAAVSSADFDKCSCVVTAAARITAGGAALISVRL